MLFSPQAHERLIEDEWNPDRVRSAIAEIAEDAEERFEDGWPTHPQDSDGGIDEERRFRTVYLGGAGVVQAIDSLQRRGLVELRRDYVPYLETRYEPDFGDDDQERSLWMGETGIRLVLQRLSPSQENADRLEQGPHLPDEGSDGQRLRLQGLEGAAEAGLDETRPARRGGRAHRPLQHLWRSARGILIRIRSVTRKLKTHASLHRRVARDTSPMGRPER